MKISGVEGEITAEILDCLNGLVEQVPRGENSGGKGGWFFDT